ncbi:MAG: hypothetical protein HYT08_01510 [Candidatus Levybacteria bacterium]|nr:hypothetical protein [Candidatus Levybacteria bacterium]
MKFLVKYKILLILLALLMMHIFLRSYQMEARNQFTWDQVDNAWAAKNIIIDYKYPLVGMQAKQNSGFYIGPLYYYFIAPFYFAFNLDPIASGFIALATSIITFFVFFYVFKKLFSTSFALIGLAIYVFSFSFIVADRVQWPINFIPIISLLIFFSLYRIMIGEKKYLIHLGIFLGLSLHLNFTSIFLLIITVLCLPFFNWNRGLIKYGLVSVILFFIFLAPNIIYEIQNKYSSQQNLTKYLTTYYHGFHFVRFFQLSKDAFTEVADIIYISFLKPLRYLILPIFLILYNFKNRSKEKMVVSYLVVLWFVVPWIIFSLYKGEITNYYFSLTRPIAIIVFTYLVLKIYFMKNIFPKIVIFGLGIYYVIFNFIIFYNARFEGLDFHRKKVMKEINKGKKIEFTQGVPESYIYYIYTRNNNNEK